MKKINVLMCCSELSVKGGMVSVVKNYLNYEHWEYYRIIYVPTHTEKNKVILAMYFLIAYVKVLFMAIFSSIKIAHLHTAERGSFFRKAILVRTLKKFGVKTIMHHHAAEFEEFYSNLSDKKKLYVNKTLEMTDLNIVLSQRLVSMIKDKAPNAKVEVLYNAVPTYATNPYNQQSKNVLFLGRLGKRKGTYDLLSTIKMIDLNIPSDIKFFLCGDGEIEEVKKKVKDLNLGHRIAYIGWITEEKKEEFLHQTCINILPSYNEGLPMSVLETMAYGIASITTNIASIPEVVFDDVNGYLVRPGDIESLSMKMMEILTNPSKRLSFSKEAHELITGSFSLEKHMFNLKSMYDELVGEVND
ncbi:glycosyltransferase family 4 protein [Anaerosporobacter sp.]|uniref:glycosyltransferase family 4 protein n=1 Tax=Anaerosporobacter sp. TaxID=1872529 RepID=UPI00286F63F3|nr:glycosyltransferase family 4 protein [Anaerosporobacter sp.]